MSAIQKDKLGIIRICIWVRRTRDLMNLLFLRRCYFARNRKETGNPRKVNLQTNLGLVLQHLEDVQVGLGFIAYERFKVRFFRFVDLHGQILQIFTP